MPFNTTSNFTMFDENFSFDSPRSPSINSSTAATRDSSRSVSPCSAAGPYPPARFSVTDLAVQFADQRIRREAPICYDSCDAYANNDNDADWSIPSIDDEEYDQLSRSRTFPQRPHSPSRRVQRQLNTRLLCTTSHHRDIAALVARMVNSKEQCSITPPESMTPTEIENEDEGYDSGEDTMASTPRRQSVASTKSKSGYKRSSDLKNGGACVSKNIRLRKDRHHRRNRTSDTT